ncbi:amino acid ABC transporter ATP-binding protein [Thorsellia kenyensis]|uniref:Amino acid ABC transporter ATP-binding protein n=1 Tax=Thorsellia kenyensis TaxID=1549888 RepID=A0ABV6CAW6_9GAMM
MITIHSLNKSFGSEHILKNISLNIKEGETVSILGPSGAGKSTLIRCLNFLENATSGYLTINNIEIDLTQADNKQKNAIRQCTGMVFQSFNLFSHLTALENIMLGLIKVKKLPKLEAKNKALKYLSLVGLADKADAYPARLSGGQQQRIGIARALALEPKILLMDEPTSALDPELVQEVLILIKEIAKENITLLVVTHEINFARQIADKIIFMEKGEVVAFEETEHFFAQHRSERIRQFFQNYNEDPLCYI